MLTCSHLVLPTHPFHEELRISIHGESHLVDLLDIVQRLAVSVDLDRDLSACNGSLIFVDFPADSATRPASFTSFAINALQNHIPSSFLHCIHDHCPDKIFVC